jgi:hypothetical protein
VKALILMENGLDELSPKAILKFSTSSWHHSTYRHHPHYYYAFDPSRHPPAMFFIDQHVLVGIRIPCFIVPGVHFENRTNYRINSIFVALVSYILNAASFNACLSLHRFTRQGLLLYTMCWIQFVGACFNERKFVLFDCFEIDRSINLKLRPKS